ncbi:MAG TPA: hypothetical protein DD381_14250 [Lentisphaeria bacterium]|nr:MAG: hypothetical protein A2X47_01015 [Lentisphaerae bacterium GWF2_38_69]HBM17486.1 hypothetical protein [Lentisphaeria bacterium]
MENFQIKFDLDSFIKVRTGKKISTSSLSKKADISRVTLWRVEKGEIQPKEKHIRALAKALNVGVEMISNLPKEIPHSEKDLNDEKKSFKKWISFEETDDTERKKSHTSIINALHEHFSESTKAVKLIKTLINFSDVMLYVKDYKQKYMAASKAFLELVSLPSELSISGKVDMEIFTAEEAKKNTEEDQKVILSGESIRNREDYIPGSRKKRFGLISKIPTFDNEGKLTGLVGSFMDITHRKKTEFLANDLKRCIEFLENRIIWLGIGKLTEMKNKSLYPKEIIYFSNSLVHIDLRDKNDPDSYLKQMELIDSLKEAPISYDMKKVKEEGVSTIYYRMKTPDMKEILNCKSSLYYIDKFDLYFGISELDVIKTYTDFLLNDLSELNLNIKTSERINQIITSCEKAMQARIDYDKYINMRDSARD